MTHVRVMSFSSSTDQLLATAGVREIDSIILDIRGDDARTWINGQATADLRDLHEGAGIYTLIVNLKGRVIADGFVSAIGNDVRISVPRATLDELLAQLEKHIIMEDVEIVRRDDLAILTAQGARASELETPAGGERVEANRLKKGIDFIVPSAEKNQALANLLSQATKLGGGAFDDATWALAHFEHRIPLFGSDFGPTTYPQEAGLEHRAVSFQKGCYHGQEVICMLENRGQISKRLVALELEGDAPVDLEIALKNGSETEIGKITSWLAHDQHTHAFAYVKRADAVAGTVLHAGTRKATVSGIVGES